MRCKTDLKFTTLQIPFPSPPFHNKPRHPHFMLGVGYIPAACFPFVPLALENLLLPFLSLTGGLSPDPEKQLVFFPVVSCPVLFLLEKTAQNAFRKVGGKQRSRRSLQVVERESQFLRKWPGHWFVLFYFFFLFLLLFQDKCTNEDDGNNKSNNNNKNNLPFA